MSYYEDVYQKRVGFRGDTKKEIIVQDAEKQFLENLAESPNREEISIDGVATSAIILTNKSDASKLTMHMHTMKTTAVTPGSVILWGSEYWLILSTDKFSLPSYNKSLIIRCNVMMKYLNDVKVVKEIPVVFLGTLDSVLREAVYRQMGMAIQLDDRRAMILTPRVKFKNNTRLMLDKRVWRTVDYDSTSNKYVVYTSLQEDNFDSSRDDLENDVADGLFIDEWDIILNFSTFDIEIGESLPLSVTITKNKVAVPNAAFTLTINNAIAQVDGDYRVVGVAAGSTPLTVTLTDHPEVVKTAMVNVANPEMTETYLVAGPDSLLFGESGSYQLIFDSNGTLTPIAATWTLSDVGGGLTLATLKQVNSVSYTVKANENGDTGEVRLTATYGGNSYSKIITIKTLW